MLGHAPGQLLGCSLWQGLDLLDCVRGALAVDRSGSMVLDELICSRSPGGIVSNIENHTTTVMVASWYIWWSRRQIKNKEPVPSPERSVLNIKGIVSNGAKLKGMGNIVRRH